jgi:hypothetical protein
MIEKAKDPDDQFKRPKLVKEEVNLHGAPKASKFWELIKAQKYRPLEELDKIAEDYRLTPQ